MKKLAAIMLLCMACILFWGFPVYADTEPTAAESAQSTEAGQKATAVSESIAGGDTVGSASNASTSASSGSTAASSDSTAASSDSTAASSDSTAASSGSTAASSGSTAAFSGSTAASSDSTAASSDSTAASSDSTAASSGSTAASSDSTAASSGIVSSQTAFQNAVVSVENGWYTDKNGTQYYYENGVMKTGWLVTGGERYWLDDATGALTKGQWFSVDGYIYLAQPDGRISRGFVGSGENCFYFDDDGKQVFGLFRAFTDQQLYYADPDGRVAYQDEIVNWNGGTYFVQSGGHVRVNQWVTSGASSYYVNDAGQVQKGWLVTGGERYWLDLSTGALVKNQWFYQDGAIYLAREDGKIARGWVGTSPDRFYFNDDGKQQFGIVTVGNSLYYITADGRLAYKEQTISVNGLTYYVQSNGQIRTSQWVNVGAFTYYVNGAGQIQKGWLVTGGERYWLDPTAGALVKNQWFYQDGAIYLAREDGKIARGWVGTSPDRFYFDDDGKQQFGIVNVGGTLYYIESDGRLATTARSVAWKDKIYYVQSDGRVRTNQFFTDGSNTYYLGADGQRTLGWVVTGGQRYWLDAVTGVLVKNQWFACDGNIYLANADGTIARGWLNMGSDSFYFDDDGRQQHSWVVTGGERYWFGDNGRLVKNRWFADNGSIYLAGSDGKITRGWLKASADITFYFDDDGKQQFNWLVTGGERYYFGTNGILAVNTWFTVNDKSYYAFASGACARGWQQIGPMSYLFDNDGVYTGNFKTLSGILGIDVSSYQGGIDWAAVKASGVQFAIIRVLGWNKTAGTYQIDSMFNTNMQNALNAGVQVGAYIYSYANSESQMLTEVNNWAIPALNAWKDRITYPVYIDYEDNLLLSQTSSNDQRTNIVRTGMDALQTNGYLSGFYTYYNFAKSYLNTQQLIDEGYDFWVAHTSASSNPWPNSTIWQNSHSGILNSISGKVDLNISTVDYAQFNANVTVYDVNTSSYVTGRVRDIVARMVQNEVGNGIGLTGLDKNALFKVQAVAANSWLQYQRAHGVANPKVGLAASGAVNSDVLCRTNQVIRLTLQYNGVVANAAYGSASASKTNTADNVGWGNVPYLTSVDSAYENWSSSSAAFQGKSTTLTAAQVKEGIEKILGAGATNNYSYAKWITDVKTDASGYCTSVKLCGTVISGNRFYQDLKGLRSPNFKVTYNNDGTWTFVTYGNGNCVGLSQYGAAGYIANSYNWRWVLLHYFPGTVIS